MKKQKIIHHTFESFRHSAAALSRGTVVEEKEDGLFEIRLEQPLTNFAPQQSTFIYTKIVFDKEACSRIKSIVTQEERNILAASHRDHSWDGGTGLGPNSLTAKYSSYNIFNWDYPFVQNLLGEIKAGLRKCAQHFNESFSKDFSVWGQCWANTMYYGQEIQPHQHRCKGHSLMSGHLFVQGNETSTFYQPSLERTEHLEVPNLPGELTLFQPHIMHWTSKYLQKGEPRISIAFDLICDYNEPQFCDPNHWKRVFTFAELRD